MGKYPSINPQYWGGSSTDLLLGITPLLFFNSIKEKAYYLFTTLPQIQRLRNMEKANEPFMLWGFMR